jgi:hypothetical protein
MIEWRSKPTEEDSVTQTAEYEPRVKTFEPSQYEQASLRAQEALSVAKHFSANPAVVDTLEALYGAMKAEPEDTLLTSDFRYLEARAERAQDLVRTYFHPSNPAVLGHLAQAREHLKIAYRKS